MYANTHAHTLSLLFTHTHTHTDLNKTLTTDEFFDPTNIHRFDCTEEHMGGAGDAGQVRERESSRARDITTLPRPAEYTYTTLSFKRTGRRAPRLAMCLFIYFYFFFSFLFSYQWLNQKGSEFGDMWLGLVASEGKGKAVAVRALSVGVSTYIK